MRKFVILSFILLVISPGVRAMGLKDAFHALSNLPNVSVTAPDYNLPVVADVIKNGKIAAAYNLGREQASETGNAAYAILNQVPLAYMINGANNNDVAAFVYADTVAEGTDEVLVAVMSGYKGLVVFIYGTIEPSARDAIQKASLHMQGDYLCIEAVMPDGSGFNIVLGKGR